MTDTRLTSSRYVDLLHRDGERLLAAAEGALDRPVPACERWRVRDVVGHLGTVFAHKVVALEAGRRPEPGEWSGPPDGADVVQWCHGLLHRLSADLSGREADSPVWTWWEPDQTAGFWQRRMALETAIHRVDVESAIGEVTPVPADLAVDGIDEVLHIMLADVREFDVLGPVVDDRRVTVGIGPVHVGGSPHEVLLWLWGRDGVSDAEVELTGSAADIDLARRHLRAATQ